MNKHTLKYRPKVGDLITLNGNDDAAVFKITYLIGFSAEIIDPTISHLGKQTPQWCAQDECWPATKIQIKNSGLEE